MSVSKDNSAILKNRRTDYVIGGLIASAGIICLIVFNPIGWTKGKWNFWWAMGFKCPKDVEVVNSFFAEAVDSRDEAYYFELKPSTASTIFNTLRDKKGLAPLIYDSTNGQFFTTPTSQPMWFAPKPMHFYEMWFSTNHNPCNALLDKKTGSIFILAQKDF